jgi:anaerobic selenocysteine-containing dehydrogenase
VSEEGTPRLDIHPNDASLRGIADGERVRIFNDRGSFTATARVGERRVKAWSSHLGLVAEALARRPQCQRGDLAGADRSRRAATFYDCLVEIARE